MGMDFVSKKKYYRNPRGEVTEVKVREMDFRGLVRISQHGCMCPRSLYDTAGEASYAFRNLLPEETELVIREVMEVDGLGERQDEFREMCRKFTLGLFENFDSRYFANRIHDHIARERRDGRHGVDIFIKG